MTPSQNVLEAQLNDFDPNLRREALSELLAAAKRGEITLPPQGNRFNMHCHTFLSYNGYGLSPSGAVWKACKEGLCALGLVDFDVLDGVDEFLEACHMAGLRAAAGLESRVFVPAFGDRVMNSPGEPGISYHMGMGFVTSHVEDRALLDELLGIAQNRNQGMLERVNAHLGSVRLHYEADVLPRTPRGNATERHLCEAYDAKAREVFPDRAARTAFWAGKLGLPAEKVSECLDDGPVFQGLIRGKLMKAGGPGYVQPDGADFPQLDAINAFILAHGAIPAYAFVDGASEGEQAMEELLEVMMDSGAAAVNIIPDRNWNFKDPEVRRVKGEALDHFVALAQERHLPIIIGTEMNAFGQRFVDDFEAPELAKHYPAFLEGAYIVHAHTLFQAHAGMGYLSDWARANFESVASKNTFYRKFGEAIPSRDHACFAKIDPEVSAREIAQNLGCTGI